MHKIRISELKAGMVLGKPIYSQESQQILLSYGTKLNEGLIKKLSTTGIKEVVIADPYTLFVKPVNQMTNYLKETYTKTIIKYSSDAAEGNLCDAMVSISKMVKKTSEKICADEELLNFCIQMKILEDGRLFSASVLSSVFSGLVAGAMGLYNDMYDIMVGGLLHNIGCLEMPFLIGIKNKKGQDELLWREHTVYGYYFALQQNISRDIAKIILHHHENWDGSGYPKQLKGEEIPLGARIVNVCGAVSSQMYFDHLQPHEAMEYIYCGSNIFFDKKIVDTFVSNITLYPLGSMVRLTTGEVGIISNVRKNYGPRPVVFVFYNRFNKPLSEPKVVDLGTERTVFIKEILS